MDDTIGSFQAKTQFAELLDKVEHGAEVTITRHGKPVAKLVPVHRSSDSSRNQAAVDAILALGATIRKRSKGKILVTQAEIREWRHEGHRY